MFCPKCGTEIKDGSKFCPKCGASVVTTSQTARYATDSKVSDVVEEKKPTIAVEENNATTTNNNCAENSNLTEQEAKKKKYYIWGTYACAFIGLWGFMSEGGFSLSWWWWICAIVLILAALGAYGSQENTREKLDAAKATLWASAIIFVLMSQFLSPSSKKEKASSSKKEKVIERKERFCKYCDKPYMVDDESYYSRETAMFQYCEEHRHNPRIVPQPSWAKYRNYNW